MFQFSVSVEHLNFFHLHDKKRVFQTVIFSRLIRNFYLKKDIVAFLLTIFKISQKTTTKIDTDVQPNLNNCKID